MLLRSEQYAPAVKTVCFFGFTCMCRTGGKGKGHGETLGGCGQNGMLLVRLHKGVFGKVDLWKFLGGVGGVRKALHCFGRAAPWGRRHANGGAALGYERLRPPAASF